MTPAGESKPPEDRLRQEIQTRHPALGVEIDGAINTLRKLKQITGTLATGQSFDGPGGDAAASQTTDATAVPASSADADDATFNLNPGARREVPLLAAGESFGRYQVARQLGRGAMGAVYLAYDSNLQRFVALKTPFLGDKPQVIKRFYREARALAQIRSPYICPIYDVEQISGIHYLSMAFIDGKPLSRVILEEKSKDHYWIADVVQKIVRGIQKAHEKSIIHRDLKPDNIMIDADGEPIVMDFGLARRVDDEIKVTAAGRILGTPAYMSPEQAEGDAAKIGPSTDLYSLGVILYEMLTGRVPFDGSFISVLRQISSEPPPRPSAVCPEIAADSPLEQICLQMLAKAPADRFPSMAAAADALEQWSHGGAPPAAGPSLLARTWAWLRTAFSRRPSPKDPAKAPSVEAIPDRTRADSRASGAPASSNTSLSGSKTTCCQWQAIPSKS